MKKSSMCEKSQNTSETNLVNPQVDKNLSLARNVIEAMVPKSLPEIAGVELSSFYRAGNTLGGDLFDVVRINEDQIAFLLFDVSGVGVASALIASMAKASFMRHIRDVQSPRSVLSRVNTDLHAQINSDYYLTAFVGMLDLHSNKLVYCNAAHPWPVVYHREEQTLSFLKSSGLFVGLFADGLYDEKSMYLNPGDWLILFSNGLYRLFDPLSDMIGRKALENLIQSSIPTSSPAMFTANIEALVNKEKETNGSDDIALVAMHLQTHSRMAQIREKLGFVGIEPVYLQFIHYFEDMDFAAAAILRDMDEYGFPDDSIRKMKIALTELLANAIFHGNNKDHSKKVTIGHHINKKCVIVSIMDEGTGFSINDVADPTLPENLEKDCGRGIFIVRNYVDSLTFNELGNRVTIVKNYLHG